MKECHVQNPKRICITLHSFPSRVPDESIPIRKIPRVSHGDHRVIKQGEVSFTIDDKAGSINKQPSVDQKSRNEEGEWEMIFSREVQGTMQHWNRVLWGQTERIQCRSTSVLKGPTPIEPAVPCRSIFHNR